jgi:hypothetical protein
MIPDDQAAGIQINLRSNPNVIANLGRPVVAPLYIRLRSDKNSIADLEGIEVLEPDTALDHHAVPEAARDGTPQGSAHETVDFPVAMREARPLLEQGGGGEAGPQVLRKPDFERRVDHRFRSAMDRRGNAAFGCSETSHTDDCDGPPAKQGPRVRV